MFQLPPSRRPRSTPRCPPATPTSTAGWAACPGWRATATWAPRSSCSTPASPCPPPPATPAPRSSRTRPHTDLGTHIFRYYYTPDFSLMCPRILILICHIHIKRWANANHMLSLQLRHKLRQSEPGPEQLGLRRQEQLRQRQRAGQGGRELQQHGR